MSNDFEIIYDCLEKGMNQKETAEVLGCSTRSISKKIAEIQRDQGILTQYRALQSLQLTQLQARILEAITPEKIADAPLRDLVLAFKILKENELTLDGKPKELKGLVGYLLQIEREEAQLANPTDSLPAIEAEFTESDEYIPNL